jgi:hypothetical protein
MQRFKLLEGVSGAKPPTSKDGKAGGSLAKRANAPQALPPGAKPPTTTDSKSAAIHRGAGVQARPGDLKRCPSIA